MARLITEPAIQKAVREVKSGAKTEARLTDPAPRGAGRLLLVVKPTAATWYAMRTVAGRRALTKLGTFPGMGIAAAREAFAGTATTPLQKAPPQVGTFGEMCAGYLDSLGDKPTRWQPERLFQIAQEFIPADRLARDVTPENIVAVIKPIYDRGARVQADKMRMYLSAAFRWAMLAAHDYRVKSPKTWGLKTNPVDVVPRDTKAQGVGNRWLSETEYRHLLAATETFGTQRTRVRDAIALIMLTGQRVREILHLRAGQWDSQSRLLSWDKTKNGKPHVLPVCAKAAAILDKLVPSDEGWLFPGERGGHQNDGAVLMWLRRYSESREIEPVTGRDLRRTWKTLAGHAGLTKTERDLLQNHTEGDVSSRHYDRYEYLPEKRLAVEKWESWLQQKVSRQPAHSDADRVVHG